MKFLKIAGLTAIVLIALAALGVNLAFAQQPTQEDTPSLWQSMSNMMQGSGMMGGQSMQAMHEQMTQNGGMADMHRQMTENGGMDEMHKQMHQSGGMHEAVWSAIAEKAFRQDRMQKTISSPLYMAVGYCSGFVTVPPQAVRYSVLLEFSF